MTTALANTPCYSNLPNLRVLAGASLLILAAAIISFGQISHENEKVIVGNAPDMEVFAHGKTIVVKETAKGVLAFGGDVIVEGRVSGDVASFGGSVIQREGAYIGGDVIIVGGKYLPDSPDPLREPGKQTVMYAGYEEELRQLTQNPSTLFSPQFSLAFIAQRVISILFWFIVSLGLVTLAPGAVGRAVAGFQGSTVKVLAIGAAGFVITTVIVIASLNVLPNYLNAIVGLMAFVLLMLAYVFGRVALHVSVGKLLHKYFFGDKTRSDAVTILIGVVVWTLVLSIPYVWTLALFVLFAAGIGLVLTSRPRKSTKISDLA